MRPGARFGEALIARSGQIPRFGNALSIFGDLPRKCQSNDYLTTHASASRHTRGREKKYAAPVWCATAAGRLAREVRAGRAACSSRVASRSFDVACGEAKGRLKHKPPQRRGVVCLGLCDVPGGTGSISSRSVVILKVPRGLRWPNSAGSTSNIDNNSTQPFVSTRSTTSVVRCRQEAF